MSDLTDIDQALNKGKGVILFVNNQLRIPSRKDAKNNSKQEAILGIHYIVLKRLDANSGKMVKLRLVTSIGNMASQPINQVKAER